MSDNLFRTIVAGFLMIVAYSMWNISINYKLQVQQQWASVAGVKIISAACRKHNSDAWCESLISSVLDNIHQMHYDNLGLVAPRNHLTAGGSSDKYRSLDFLDEHTEAETPSKKEKGLNSPGSSWWPSKQQ